jgi:hypothetical protein
MAKIGTAPHVIEAALNHISGAKSGVAGIYNQEQYPNEALPQTDEACGACGWFVSFLVGLRQGLVKLEIFLEATLA